MKKNRLKNQDIKKRLISLLMAVSMVLGVGIDLRSFAAGDVTVAITKGIYVSQYQGEDTVKVEINNKSGDKIERAIVSLEHDGLVNPPDNITTTLNQGSNEVVFKINLYGLTLGKTYYVRAKVTDSNGNIIAGPSENGSITVNFIDEEDRGKPNLPTIDEKDNTFKPDDSIQYNPQVKLQVIPPSGGLNAGVVNNVQLKITNTGNAPFNKVVAVASNLGDKMSLKNASTEKDLGAMGKLKEATVTFPVFVENSHEGGNVPMGFTVRATDPTGKVTEFPITAYVDVNGGTSLADQLEIVNIKNPQQVSPDNNFNVTFAVKNNSSKQAKNVKVTVEPAAPVVNRTKNIFVIDLEPGASKAFDVQMFVPASAEGTAQNYPIKITAETTGKDASSISQYSGVFVNTSTDKTIPQIIITNYTYGGTAAVANEVFPLNLVLKNTNAGQALKNIKISLNAEEGVFIPHNSSNSFYIPKIGPNGSVSHSIEMMTKPDAPEKTVAINVDMTYEDEKGTQIAVKDVISVPVVQQRRLEIDDVKPMDILYVGQQANISVQYYNMGKSTLNNLIISAEGDFDFPQSTKSFVGKMESGKSDYYDLAIIPNHAGEADGKLIFSFEDSNGKEIKIEKPFRLTAEEMPPMEPTDEIPMDEPGLSRNQKIGIGVAAVLILAGGTIIYKKRKKKQRDILDIDSEE